jgi:plastocyanin
MRKIATLLLVVPLGMTTGGLVAKQMISQQGRIFSIDSIAIKTGESLTFLNNDNIPHNVASISKGNEFTLVRNAQVPRQTSPSPKPARCWCSAQSIRA